MLLKLFRVRETLFWNNNLSFVSSTQNVQKCHLKKNIFIKFDFSANKNKKQVRFAEGAPEIITDTLKSGSKVRKNSKFRATNENNKTQKPVIMPASILHKIELPKAGHIKLDKVWILFFSKGRILTLFFDETNC